MKRTTITGLALLVLTSSAWAFPNPPSGLMLGVRVFENWKGLRVTDTIPGYAAEGVLLPSDVITRMADSQGVYTTRTLWQFEAAKDRVGPGAPAAIEVQRPGWGTIYFMVELQPVGGGPVAARAQGGAAPQQKMRTMIRRAPDAARMFGGAVQQPSPQPTVKPRPNPRPNPLPRPNPRPNPRPGRNPSTPINPADFFNR